MALLTNDSRFPIYEKWFIGRLLNAQSGLSAQERNIFLANWTMAMSTLKQADVAGAANLSGN